MEDNKEKEKEDEPKDERTASTEKSRIPGLSEKDRKKAEKAAHKKQQKSAEKERKRRKREEEVEKKRSDQMKTSDFLQIPPFTSTVEEFEFSDHSDASDDTDIFEDSQETQSEAEFLTPISFASVFGRREAARSCSTPNLKAGKNTNKRGASSPGYPARKKRSKSLMPGNK